MTKRLPSPSLKRTGLRLSTEAVVASLDLAEARARLRLDG